MVVKKAIHCEMSIITKHDLGLIKIIKLSIK